MSTKNPGSVNIATDILEKPESSTPGQSIPQNNKNTVGGTLSNNKRTRFGTGFFGVGTIGLAIYICYMEDVYDFVEEGCDIFGGCAEYWGYCQINNILLPDGSTLNYNQLPSQNNLKTMYSAAHVLDIIGASLFGLYFLIVLSAGQIPVPFKHSNYITAFVCALSYLISFLLLNSSPCEKYFGASNYYSDWSMGSLMKYNIFAFCLAGFYTLISVCCYFL